VFHALNIGLTEPMFKPWPGAWLCFEFGSILIEEDLTLTETVTGAKLGHWDSGRARRRSCAALIPSRVFRPTAWTNVFCSSRPEP